MYRPQDEEIILKNLDRLEEEANQIKLATFEPTIVEIKNVFNIIKDFIRERKRIIYGGYAQNSLIKMKNPNDVFYKENHIADMEFYSPDPIGDLIDLVDLLHKKGFKYCDGKEGVHSETYKVYVNFNNYCDITYMHPSIKCPTIYDKEENLLMAHPHYMLIDAYRVYTDPMTSYFRLTKTFTRFNKLLKYYPLDEEMLYNHSQTKENDNELLRFIRKNILHNSKLIIIGQYAYNQLMKISKAPSSYLHNVDYYEVISTDYNNDIAKITNILNKYNIKIKKYHPYFQFFDKSTEFYVDNKMVLRVYNSNDRCIVYRKSEKKRVLFGSYMLLFMYTLIHYIKENKYGSMLIGLLKARNKYLDKYNKTVLDKTIFQEFTFSCIGEAKDQLRESLLEGAKKKEAGKLVKFLYKPTGNPGKKPNYTFANSTGSLV
jgi:hypothetical protein